MSGFSSDLLSQIETTCGSLLYELQKIWDEVGETDEERDKMLLQLEQECLEVYRRKVDEANRSRAQLRRDIADSEAELAAICSVMGEPPVPLRQVYQSNPNVSSLKEELRSIIPQLEEMRRRRTDRQNQFLDVLDKIGKISTEIGPSEHTSSMAMDDCDLSVKKLEESRKHLQMLQKEKTARLNQVLDHLNNLNSLCLVLGMDFKQIVGEVHPSLNDYEGPIDITNSTIKKLGATTQRLREFKLQRMQKLQDLSSALLELWNLMDTPPEEQQLFQNITCNIAASEDEITEPDMLSEAIINNVVEEVSRLEELKASKMKDLVLKKKSELDEICRRSHVVLGFENEMQFSTEAIESGAIDPSLVLEQIENQIAKAKEAAFSRKEILEKVEKWMAACDEESWLDEYNRDGNRYAAGKGAHLILKRAEKARVVVSKLPAMVEALVAKTSTWEKERGIKFTYDRVELLSILEEYTILRQEKEQEHRRQRDQKRLEGQLIAEQEAMFGAKLSPAKPQTAKKVPRTSMAGLVRNTSGKRFSVGGAVLQPPKQDLLQPLKGKSITKKASEGASLSDGRTGPDAASLPSKRLSDIASNEYDEVDTTILRKPFAPITTTPLKTITVANVENRTPTITPVSTPRTPNKAMSMPMQIGKTPAPDPSVLEASAVDAHGEVEYSFEERRAGFDAQGGQISSVYV